MMYIEEITCKLERNVLSLAEQSYLVEIDYSTFLISLKDNTRALRLRFQIVIFFLE